ncbi:acyl-CoA dehydrogenase family protein [Achromobacter xylosoxidans]|uniref:acyl-CoA dehydrogenase family protein n=1 Tax=Alcaligenes xylosoxydans xylosoxydans TaxID=85698 RepID=UPI000B492BBE|nr:acyl-CoA dehydrogenase family protein [Achromobacter xylosoxidans]
MPFSARYDEYVPPRPERSSQSSHFLAPDCAGLDFYALDRGLQDLLRLYLPAAAHARLLPQFQRMGQLAGGRLNTLATVADKYPPVLHARTRWGEDEDWIEYHPAYQEMEHIAFADFQFHAMSHRAGVLGCDAPLPPVAKYALQYLFVQAEFGQMCPISVSDTSIHLIRKFGSPALQERLLPRMLSSDPAVLWKGTQFMTEKTGGSDVGALEAVARQTEGGWRLHGEKWFCSHTDADVALLLARPEGAPGGTRGLALFAMPRRLEDGSRNAYRIVRLKDKLGTRSMASGEIRLEGAQAYLVGEADQGLKHMMEQVNLSRLSHGVRAAAMMRRCLNEAMLAARHRRAFGRDVMAYPLLRRQLLKLLTPTEAALSMVMAAADIMRRAQDGDPAAAQVLRLLTPLLKLRTCRDNIAVATGAMEIRGGNGYIEDFVNARLVRDAHIGVLWEGTSNINALDAIQRAVRKDRAHEALAALLESKLEEATALPAAWRSILRDCLRRAVSLAQDVGTDERHEAQVRRAASALYYASAAVFMAWESCRPGVDARRLLLADAVLRHYLLPADPLRGVGADGETQGDRLMLQDEPLTLAQVVPMLALSS